MEGKFLVPQAHYRLCMQARLGGGVSYFLQDTLLDRAFPLPQPPPGEEWSCSIDPLDGLAILASETRSSFACDFATEHVFVGESVGDLEVRRLGDGVAVKLAELYGRPSPHA